MLSSSSAAGSVRRSTTTPSVSGSSGMACSALGASSGAAAAGGGAGAARAVRARRPRAAAAAAAAPSLQQQLPLPLLLCRAPSSSCRAAARRRRGRVAAAASAADSYDGFDGAFSSAGSSYDEYAPPVDARAFVLEKSGMVDFYALLGVDDDAPPEEIKRAYRSTCKECHPDFLGETGHNICILLNEAYEVLMDADARAAYNAQLEAALQDEDDGYSGEPLSKWMPALRPKMAKNADPNEQRAVFVDENTCIGCKQCVWHAPATFRIEAEHGRSRAYAQWLNTEDELQSAIDSCPVSCIYWTTRDQLPALEFVMQTRVERVNVGIMMAGQGRVADVFAATESFLKERRRKEEAQLRAARKYSPAQEAARREAAASLLRDHLGWFAPMFNAALRSVESTVSDTEETLRVGRRRRAEGARWRDRVVDTRAEIYYPEDSGSDEYFLVPPERALVPVRAGGGASPRASYDG